MTNFLESTTDVFNQIANSFTAHAKCLLIVIAIGFVVHITNVVFFKRRLNALAIRSRKASGLIGIVFAPWLHGDFGHLIINAIFFFVLSSMTLVIISFDNYIKLSLFLILGTGLLTWAFARRAIHLGASGVIMGYWGFILVSAIQHPSAFTIITAVVCVFYFGTMISNVIPTDPRHSWESHLFGCLCGIIAAFL